MGINGIALSTTLVTLFNASMLTILLKRKISIGYKSLISNCFKILVVSTITFLIGSFISDIYSKFIEWNFIMGLIKLLLVGIIMTISYFSLSHILKIEYMEELISKIKNKFNKKANNNEIQ